MAPTVNKKRKPKNDANNKTSYGCLLIFSNNTKPSRKYHFHIYVVRDPDNYAALRFCVHTKDGSDFADGGVDTRTASTEVQFLDEATIIQTRRKMVARSRIWYWT